jgi:hypothetical protein
VIPVAVRVKGAIEGEELKAKVTGGVTELQGYENLSNETQLWWRDAAVGDKLTATITVPSTGMYEITGKFCTAGDYGIHQISLNGKPLGGPIDFYNKDLKWKAIGFGAIILPAGEVKLEVMVTGANPQAIQRHMFGLDYLLLTPKN